MKTLPNRYFAITVKLPLAQYRAMQKRIAHLLHVQRQRVSMATLIREALENAGYRNPDCPAKRMKGGSR